MRGATATLRLPAFARDLLAKRRAGLAPQRDLLIATAWDLGHAWAPWRIVVDPLRAAREFNFGVCAGLSCLLLAREQPRMEEVAQAIVAFAPSRLVGVVLGADRYRVYIARHERVMP